MSCNSKLPIKKKDPSPLKKYEKIYIKKRKSIRKVWRKTDDNKKKELNIYIYLFIYDYMNK